MRSAPALLLVAAVSGCPAPPADDDDSSSDAGTAASSGPSAAGASSSSRGMASSVVWTGSGTTSRQNSSSARASSAQPSSTASPVSASSTSAAPSSSSAAALTSSSSAGTSGPPGTCAPRTAAADVDPWTVRAPGVGSAGITTSSAGGHNDVLLMSPDDYIRLGVRLDWGGSVVFFGLTANTGSNVIDANDTGRELQLALYDPTRAKQQCARDASCLVSPSTCAEGITYLGWDPVQGGDECNHGSTSTYEHVGDTLRVVVHPLQWNPDWDAPDCRQSACGAAGVPVAVTYTLDFRFVTTHVVEVAMEIHSDEALDHPSTAQEFPTLYVSNGAAGPDLPLLLDASGTEVNINQQVLPSLFVLDFASTAPWVAFQDPGRTYGVGLAADQGLTGFQGWRGDGASYPYFHNVRPSIQFGLGAGATVRGIAYLALGNFPTVSGQIAAATGARPPFGHVDAPAEGATTTYAPGSPVTVTGWVLDGTPQGAVEVQVDGSSAGMITVNAARPDVCAVYPAYAGCPAVGFAGTVSTSGWAACSHLLQVVATDADGNRTVLGERNLQPQ
ncbi:MAG: hypothetical protein HY904_26200 [Deltaproteobacteria bacterium]|nr:hypothetical protein [Deltaproteobacteria bacterium]